MKIATHSRVNSSYRGSILISSNYTALAMVTLNTPHQVASHGALSGLSARVSAPPVRRSICWNGPTTESPTVATTQSCTSGQNCDVFATDNRESSVPPRAQTVLTETPPAASTLTEIVIVFTG
ncbi:unnamed protein product [Tilletia laevis]|uniref:Uncharacterized protein n=1 Tax=Tilletia laevis TaxID=157183 RepID=A0A9N8M6C9_9BASI|nr:unnamed protein product [Tilletia laevis]